MKTRKTPKAFSLVELSASIIVVIVLVVGIMMTVSLVRQARLTNAKALTQSSQVAAIADLQIWLESTIPDGIKQGVEDGDAVVGWFGRGVASNADSNAASGGSDPVFCKWCVDGLPGIKFTNGTFLILPSSIDSVFKGDFVLYIVETPGQNKGYFINVEGASDNSHAIGYENATTIRFFDKTTPAISDKSDVKVHIFMVIDGVKYYAMNGLGITQLASSNNYQFPVFKFAQNDHKIYLSQLLDKVAAQNGDYILGRSDTTIAEAILISASNKNSLNPHIDTINFYLSKKFNVQTLNKGGFTSIFTDGDSDGVNDEIDSCPNTPAGSQITADGCPDNDGDGLQDAMCDGECPDKCLGESPSTTPPSGKGAPFIHSTGCWTHTLDTDKDGTPDFYDTDDDNDGILDGVDMCGNPTGLNEMRFSDDLSLCISSVIACRAGLANYSTNNANCTNKTCIYCDFNKDGSYQIRCSDYATPPSSQIALEYWRPNASLGAAENICPCGTGGPSNPNPTGCQDIEKDHDKDGIPDILDPDDDNDGILDGLDGCNGDGLNDMRFEQDFRFCTAGGNCTSGRAQYSAGHINFCGVTVKTCVYCDFNKNGSYQMRCNDYVPPSSPSNPIDSWVPNKAFGANKCPCGYGNPASPNAAGCVNL